MDARPPPRDAAAPRGADQRLDSVAAAAKVMWWEWRVPGEAVLGHGPATGFLDFDVPAGQLGVEAWLARVHPNDGPAVETAVRRCLSGECAHWEAELRLRTNDGIWRWIASVGHIAELDESGRPRRVLTTIQDIDARKRAEDIIGRDTELLEKLQDAVVCTDLDGIVTFWNAAATRLWGWRASERIGRPIFERFPAEVLERVWQIHEAVRAGEERMFDWADLREDGRRIWVEVRLGRYDDALGQPAGIVSIARDVTERRQAEDTIRRDAMVLAQLQDAVVCTDLELNVLYWNDAAERIFGWRREDILGKSVLIRLPEETHAGVVATMQRIRAGEAPPAREWEDFRRDGGRVWMLWRSQPISDPDGTVVGVASIGTDMSERRHAEAKRLELERQLLHAQKLETMGTLAGGIAHDFNNILAAILIHAELGLMERSTSPSLAQSLKEIRGASLRARELVQRILNFVRRDEPRRRPIDVRGVLEDSIKFLRATLPSTIEIRLDAAETALVALADSNRIQQVLVNLSSNAADAMPSGGRLTFQLRDREVSEPLVLPTGVLGRGHYLCIALTDTGTGMDAPTLARILEPFFTTKAAGLGTGLGLPIVTRILSEHDGGLDVQSAPGQGSTFSIYLPALSSLAPPRPTSPPRGALPRGLGERILVVDDEESIALLTRTALENLGYVAEHVTSAEAFFDRFLEAPDRYRLLITDQTMPGMTGLELVRRVRALGYGLPVILATGFRGRLDPGALASLPRLVVLEKPFELEQLAILVKRELAAG